MADELVEMVEESVADEVEASECGDAGVGPSRHLLSVPFYGGAGGLRGLALQLSQGQEL